MAVRLINGLRCYSTDLYFFISISLDEKLFAISKFLDKNFFLTKVATFKFTSFHLIFSDRLFLLYKSSFKKTLLKRAFAILGA
jgi:hypothetical protein